MSSLRNAFTVTTDDGTRDLVNEELTANGMGDLRRNWNAGRIGTEANYLAAQELGLRKDGRNAEADAVRAQIEGLQQRQALYAPTVGRVEDIHGVGDAVDWATGLVGQGAASMVDPIAIGTGIGAAGRVAGMVNHPAAKLFSKAAPYLAGVGAYGIGQRQLTGEMGNSMTADPELMARTTPQQRWEAANEFGARAALIDTVLPGHIAGKVAGKGALRAFGKTGVLGELGMEGATEAVQEHTSQQVLGQLNPNRDTSGDASDLLNASLGGFAGATGPVALGAGAQAVHNRVAKTRDALGGVAGDVTDLVTGATTQAQEKGKGLMDMARELFGRGKGPQDLQEGAPEAQDGPPGPFRLSDEELAALHPENGNADPSSMEYLQGMLNRADFAERKLGEMSSSDPKAADILRRVQEAGQDHDARINALEEGANYIGQLHTSNELNARGEAMQENVKTVGKAVGKAAASVVKGVAKGAATFGKAAWDGATSKKNAQATGPDQDRSELASSYAEDVAGKLHDGKRGVRVLARRVTEQIIEHMSMRSNDRMYSPQRNVDAHGLGNRDVVLNRLASTVKKIYGAQAQTVLDEVGKIMNGHGKKIVDYIKKEVETLSAPDGRTHERNRRAQLADTLLSMVPPKKEAALTSAGINIRDGADREKFLTLMEDFADGAGAPGLRNQLNAVFGPATVKQMVDHLNGVEIARGKDEKPAKESAVFAQSGHEGEELGEGFEVSEDGEITDYAKRQGDKQVSKRGAPKLYGFKNTQTTRNSSEWSNPLAGPRVSEAAMREWRDAVAEAKTLGTEAPEDPRIAAAAKRPSLFGKDDTLSDGRNAIEARIEHMVAKLGDKAASWSVTAKRASDVLDEMDAPDEARISTYRDYLRKALGSQKGTIEQKAKWRAEVETLGRVLRDMRSGSLVDKDANVADRSDEDDEATSGIHSLRKKRLTAQAAAIRSATDPEAKAFSAEAYASTSPARPLTLSSPGERRKALDRAKNYLSNRYIVVAEDMTNRAPEDISVSEVETMSRAGMTAMDNARKITSVVESRIKSAKISGAEANQMRKAAQREYNEVVDAYNILEFAPVEDGGKPIYIKAGDLVYWARTQRGKSESSTEGASYSPKNLGREYLGDLMTGISTILASGLVGARLPTKRNKFGVEETFETPKQGKNGRKPSVADSVPDSLRLVTMTAGQMRWKPETQDTRGPEWAGPPDFEAGGDDRADEVHQALVIEDQRLGGEPTVVDPLRDVGEMRTMDPQDYAALTTDERKTLNGFADRYSKAKGAAKAEIAREQREFLDGLGLRKDGKRYSTAVDTTSFGRQRGMTDHAKEVNDERGVKVGKMYAGESHRTVHKDAPRHADQIRRDRRMRNADGTKREVFEDGAAFPVEMTDDEISPMDFFPDQEPGAVPDEFADAQFRNRIEGYDASTTVSAEFKLSAASKAKERGLAIRAKLIPGINEGGDELTAKQLEGINEIAARIRSAYRPERREKGDDGLVGGWHYLYPVAHALNTDSLRKMAGGKDPAGLMPTLKFLRDQFKRALLDSAATPSQKAAVLRVASPAEWASKITEGNVIQLLERDAPARDEAFDTSSEQRAARTDKEAAPEVAAQAPKSQSAPAGARVDLGSTSLYGLKDQKKSDQANKFIGRGSEASSTAKYAKAWGERANTGKYTASDVVFVSAEGNRGGRIAPDFAEIGRAVKAGATIITDDRANRERSYNVGEREVAKFLHDSGYREVAPGQWKPGKLNAQSDNLSARAAPFSEFESLAARRTDKQFLPLTTRQLKLINYVLPKLPSLLQSVVRNFGFVSERGPNRGMTYVGDGIIGINFHAMKDAELWHESMSMEDRAGWVTAHELGHVADADSGFAISGNYPEELMAEARAALGKDSMLDWALNYPLGANVKSPTREMVAQLAALSALRPEILNEHLPKNAAWVREALGTVQGDGAQTAESTGVGQGSRGDGQNAGDARSRADQVFPNDGPNRVASDEDMAKAKEYLAKVMPQVKVHFENITGYSGEFIEAENVIKISTTAAAGTMETAYHEALHAFFAKFVKSDPKVLAAMRTLAENEKLLARVHALLKGFPAAQRQLADGEERLAYIFQFWAAGKLDLPVGRPTTIMQKLRKFFRRVAGMITNEERAVDLMHAFHEGKLSEPSAAGRVIADIMNQGTMTPKQLRKIDSWTQRAMGMIAPAEEILARSESKTARELAKEFFTNPGDEGNVGHEEGYINATRTISLKYTNKFASIVRNLTDRDMSDVVNHMINKELEDDAEIAYAPVRDAVKSLRKLLREVYDHTKEAGVEMGEFKGSYFPRVWSVSKLTEGRDAFIKMLVDNYPERLSGMVSAVDKDGKKNMTAESIAAEIWQFLTTVTAQDGRNDVTRQDGVLAPFFASGENRHFAWIETKHSGDFQHKNLTNIATGYIHQSVKAAEYTRRFGRSGKILEKKLKAVRAELHEVAASKLNAQEFGSKDEANKWVEERMKNINRACGAMEGTLGKDISPTLRKFNSWMMVYQNLRLLPLTLFASVVDPLGMVARGATMKEAYETFLRGMKEVFTNWADMVRENPKERVADKWEILAEHIGALDSILFSHHVAEEYSSTYLSPGAKKVNDALFKINGMESWNRGVRAGAVRSAVKFIERHSKLPEVHSERWMRELGLSPGHIALDPFGELILDTKELAAAKGISEPEAARRVEVLHSAINRWVLGAILTSNAAQRPAWASDPHYSIFFHLKQFSYSFHQTILKRAVKEMNHGNLAPIGAFAGYIPIMIASDVVKGLIVGGGELPNHMKGYDLGDWVKHGIERSGTLGIAGIGVDASQDIFSLAGPGVEQVMDAMVDPLEQTTVRALPLSPMYAQLLK